MRKMPIKRARKICTLFKISDEDLGSLTNGKVHTSLIKNTAQFLVNNLSNEDVKKLHKIIEKMK